MRRTWAALLGTSALALSAAACSSPATGSPDGSTADAARSDTSTPKRDAARDTSSPTRDAGEDTAKHPTKDAGEDAPAHPKDAHGDGHPGDAAVDSPREDASKDATPRDASDASPRDSAPDRKDASAVSVAVGPSPATLTPGGTVVLTVTLSRPEAAGVNVTVTGLPSGVTASTLTIAAGSTSGGVTLTATSGATQGVTTPSVHAGTASQSFSLVVPGATGTLDTSFNGSGVANITPAGGDTTATALSVAVDSDDSIVVGGSLSASTTSGWGVVRFNADGTNDTTFNGNITSTSEGAVLPTDGSLAGLAIVSGTGKIVIAGTDTSSGSTSLAVSILNADGTRNESFGSGGLYTYSPSAGARFGSVTAMAVNSADDIAIVGTSGTGGPIVATLTGPDGTPTPGLYTGLLSTAQLAGVAYASNGDIVVGGSSPSGGGQFYVARLSSGLAPVAGFGGMYGPGADAGTSNQYLTANALALDPSDDVFVVGNDGNDDYFAAMTSISSTGTPTVVGGYAMPGPNQQNGVGFVGAASNANNLVVAVGSGVFHSDEWHVGYVSRVKSSGALDTTFATSGVYMISDTANDNNLTFNAVAIDSIGRIIVVGNYSAGFYVTRLWP